MPIWHPCLPIAESLDAGLQRGRPQLRAFAPLLAAPPLPPPSDRRPSTGPARLAGMHCMR